MEARQEDILSMKIVTVDYVDNTPPSILDQMPEVQTVKAALEYNIGRERAFKNGQVLNRKGIRVSKEELREIMMQKGYETAAQVAAYAIEINDDELESSVTYVYSTLQLMRDTDVADACQSIFDIATVQLPNLAPFSTTGASLDELKDAIINYNFMLPKTRAGIVARAAFTAQIAELFVEDDILLNRLDKLVNMLRFKEPTFYKEYYSSRKIVDTGHRTLSIKGNITNELGQPIKDVIITVETPNKETAKSTAKGNYQLKGIEDGVFPVTFQRNGYTTERAFIVFTPNTRVDFSVVLKAAVLNQESA